jgi:hypothetical protein
MGTLQMTNNRRHDLEPTLASPAKVQAAERQTRSGQVTRFRIIAAVPVGVVLRIVAGIPPSCSRVRYKDPSSELGIL